MSISSSSPSLKRRKMMSSSSRSPVSISSSRSLLKSPERNPRFGGDPPGPLPPPRGGDIEVDMFGGKVKARVALEIVEKTE